jgi:phthalate 4,5-cis-dihydrodiol dehydrogenase
MINSIQHGEVLRLGIIGLGQAGTMMISALIDHPYIKITAAADLNEENLTAFRRDFKVETYYSVQDMCKSDQVDAVYIATPSRYHAEHAIIAAEHRKHAIVEKPMSLSLQEADNVIQAFKRNGVHVVVNHKRSLDPPIQKIREIVTSGYLGKLGMINIWQFSDWLYRPRTPQELADGGVVLRQGSHHFDIIRLIGGGKVTSVRAMTGVWDKNRNAEGSYIAYLQFENGTAASSVYNGYNHFNTSEVTLGLKGAGSGFTPLTDISKLNEIGRKSKNVLISDEINIKKSTGYVSFQNQHKDKREDQKAPFGFLIVSCEHGDIRVSADGLLVYGKEENYVIPLQNQPSGIHMILGQFYDLITKQQPTIYDGCWGKAALEICLKVIESAEKGEEVYLRFQYGIDG